MRPRNWTPRERDKAVRNLNRATATVATVAVGATAGFAIMMLPGTVTATSAPTSPSVVAPQEDGPNAADDTSTGDGSSIYPNTVPVPQLAAPHSNSGSS